MKQLKFISAVLSGIMLTMFSCTKPEPVVSETPTDWTEVAGTYSCVATVYTINSNGSLSQNGSPYILSVSAQRKSTDNGILEFTTGSGLIQFANNARINDIIVFDLPQQKYRETDGTDYPSQGYSYWEAGGKKYHGTYDATNKELKFSFLVFHSTSTTPNTVHVIRGTKQ